MKVVLSVSSYVRACVCVRTCMCAHAYMRAVHAHAAVRVLYCEQTLGLGARWSTPRAAWCIAVTRGMASMAELRLARCSATLHSVDKVPGDT
jgi:hypothetical protein